MLEKAKKKVADIMDNIERIREENERKRKEEAEAAARLEAERQEEEARLEAERLEEEAQLEAERREAEARLEAERQAKLQAEKEAFARLSENELHADTALIIQALYTRIEELEGNVESLKKELEGNVESIEKELKRVRSDVSSADMTANIAVVRSFMK